jgi:predicted DNA-binding transcriptional regulator YafY
VEPADLVKATELICRAVARRRRLSFAYKGSTRLVDPYILGTNAEGRLLLSAVQRTGGSGSGFRSFAISEIIALEVTEERFFGNHPDYNRGDRLFAEILCQV